MQDDPRDKRQATKVLYLVACFKQTCIMEQASLFGSTSSSANNGLGKGGDAGLAR